MPSKQSIKRIKDKLRWEESKADRSVQLKAYYEQNKEVILETNQTKYCNNPTEKRSSSRIYSKKQYELNPQENKTLSKKQYELNLAVKRHHQKSSMSLIPRIKGIITKIL